MARKKPVMARKIQRNIEKWRNHWHDNENQYNDFTQFVLGNQWLDDEARVFETYKKIPLTANKTAPICNYILGEQRQNTPTIQVQPTQKTTEQEAEIREALVKEITFNSDSSVVFQTAFQCAVIGGFGAFSVKNKYESNYSFDQIIELEEIKIPTRCFWDISAENRCKTDGMFSGITIRMSREKFKKIYGVDIERDIGTMNLEDDEHTVFNDDDAITIVEYYERKYSTVELKQLSNQRIVDEKEFKMLERVTVDDAEMLLDDGEIVTVINKRLAPRYKVMYYLYAGDYELEREEFPSEQLPIVFVDQNSFYDKEGRQVCRPSMKDVKDTQRYINYIRTQCAYLLKISRYDQFLVAAGNVRSNDTAQIWRDPTNIQGGLKFDETASGFIPQQLKPAELSQSLIQQYDSATLDMQACTGIYQTQLGDKGNEASGRAIDSRNRQGSYTTYVMRSNLDRAVACAAQIINEMIPKVYDTERQIRITLKDKGEQSVQINKPMDEYGGQIMNDMTQGRYNIKLKPGPSYEGQKQEALDSMQMLLQADPQIFSMIADLYVENLPLTNNIELRNRLRTIVPPEIIQAGKTGEPLPPKPPQPSPEQQMMQVKMQELQMQEKKLELEQQKLQITAQESGQNIQQKWQALENDRQKAAAQLQEMELKYIAETQRTHADTQIAHANNIVSLLKHEGSYTHGTKNN